MRINAYLARAGIASRRKADELIKAGKVRINGQLAGLDTEITDNDEVTLDGRAVKLQKLRYILLYKPSGTVTTLNDPQGRKTIVQLIGVPERVIPVGRLDYDTTGALLLTNDGELAHKLMHPSFEVDKTYEAEVGGKITPEMLNKLSIGVKLDDGLTAPAEAKMLGQNKISLTVHEGRKHQVKRMLAAVGLTVERLHRKTYAGLGVEGLVPGQWRELTKEEIDKLKMVQ